MSLLNRSLSHKYKENNKGVDILANIGSCLQCKVFFHNFRELPHALKGIVNMDRMGIPNMRCKKL